MKAKDVVEFKKKPDSDQLANGTLAYKAPLKDGNGKEAYWYINTGKAKKLIIIHESQIVGLVKSA